MHLIDIHLIKHAKKTNLSLFQCLKKLSFIITQYTFTRMRQNKAYLLNVGSEIIPVYCHMEGTTQLEACGGGGWTLVMKIDGKKVAAAKKQLYLLFIKNILHMFMIGSSPSTNSS